MKRESFPEEGIGLLVLAALFWGGYKLYVQYNTNRATFLTWLAIAGAVALVLVIGAVALVEWMRQRTNRKRDASIEKIIGNGLEKEVYNFINRFGLEKSKKGNWSFRKYNFEWDRLKDFRENLQEHGIGVSSKKWEGTLFILRHFIQIQEEKVTRDSIGIAPKRFSTLSPQEFENLLYRLFVASGYSVQRTGKPGDQGADLVANKGTDRVVIQAKRYQGSVGNSAVQEAVAAQKLYGCNKASVVTTSEFTTEAKTLAKANNVELVGKDRLQQLLLESLKESWA